MIGGDVVLDTMPKNTVHKKKFNKKTGNTKFDAERAEYEKLTLKIDREADELHNRIGEISREIQSLTKSDKNRELKDELSKKMNQLRREKDLITQEKDVIYDELSKLEETIKTILTEVDQIKGKLKYKTSEDVVREISVLKGKLESGEVKIADEERVLNEVTKLNKLLKTLRDVEERYGQVKMLRTKIDESKKIIAEKLRLRRECNDKMVELGKEMGILTNNRSASQEKINLLVQDRIRLWEEIGEKNTARQKLTLKFRECQREHELWMANERLKRERIAQKKAIENAIHVLRTKLKELDNLPSKKKISQCILLEEYFHKITLNQPSKKDVKDSRVLEEYSGEILRNKSATDDKESCYYLPESKTSRKNRNVSNEKIGKLATPDIWVLVGLEELHVDMPLKISDVDRTIQGLFETRSGLEEEERNRLRELDQQRILIQVEIDEKMKQLGGIVIE